MVLPDRTWPGKLLLVAVNDASTREVVGRKLYHDAILGKDADVVLTHLSADVSEYLVAVFELNAKHRIGQRFDNSALYLDSTVFLGHILRDPGSHTWLIASVSVTVMPTDRPE